MRLQPFARANTFPYDCPSAECWGTDEHSVADFKCCWEFPTFNWLLGRPVVAAYTVYFGSPDGYSYALERRPVRLTGGTKSAVTSFTTLRSKSFGTTRGEQEDRCNALDLCFTQDRAVWVDCPVWTGLERLLLV